MPWTAGPVIIEAPQQVPKYSDAPITTGRQMRQLVYELFELRDEETRTVEGRVAGDESNPRRLGKSRRRR